MCSQHCKHGGVCELEEGHQGEHDSSFCKWKDEESLTKEEADEIFNELIFNELQLYWLN